MSKKVVVAAERERSECEGKIVDSGGTYCTQSLHGRHDLLDRLFHLYDPYRDHPYPDIHYLFHGL